MSDGQTRAPAAPAVPALVPQPRLPCAFHCAANLQLEQNQGLLCHGSLAGLSLDLHSEQADDSNAGSGRSVGVFKETALVN